MNYYPHHIGDYAKDTRALTQAEHGAYRLLIDEAYSSENGVDADEVYAISCAHTPSEKKNTDRVLAKFFVLKDGRYYQKRIDFEVAKYQEKSAKASASAKQKWANKDANAMRTQCERIANADEAHEERRCETDAYPITNNQEPITKEDLTPLSGKPDLAARERNRQAREVIDFLNAKTGKNYQHVEANLKLVVSRMKEGATVDDCRAVIANRFRKWNGDPKMEQYLRPATLFNATNFAQYRGELSDVIPQELPGMQRQDPVRLDELSMRLASKFAAQ